MRGFLVIGLAAAVATGCSEQKQIPAVGPGSEIVVLAAAESRELGERVAGILSTEIRLVQFEPTFDVVEGDVADWSFYKTRKLLFAVGTPDDEQLTELLRKETGVRTPTSVPGLWIVTEPFSAGQVMFVLAGEGDALRDVLADRSDELLGVVEEAAVTLMLTNLFRAGEIEGARDDMMTAWGWGVRVPPGWKVDQEFAQERFIRIWHDAPVKQLFVSWEVGRIERPPREWLERRHELVRDFYDGDAVVPDRSEAAPGATPFGLDGTVLAGLWENEEYVIGGPFRSWAFWCPEDNRTYLVDLCVYAPDRPKRPLMRNLEAVARTFRCGCVPAPGAPS